MDRAGASSVPPHTSDSEDNGDVYLDASDCNEMDPQDMDLNKAMEQAQLAIDYFFNNKFFEAREVMKKWANTSLYHATGECVFSFLCATLTFDRELISDANTKIKHCINLCNEQRKHRTIGDNLNSMVGKLNYNAYSELEVHAELCFAEVLLLKALLTFIEDEELLSFVKGSLKIKQCFSSYKECSNILKKRVWKDATSKLHFESGVRMGIGSFNLMISLLPQRIIRILEFVGFSGNKEQGLEELMAGYTSDGGIRQVLCVMTLLGYHLIVCYVITDHPGDLPLCEDIISKQLEIYPTCVWFLFFKARLEYMKGNLENAVTWYKRSWESQDAWPQFHHLCYWELLWVHCLSLQWNEAQTYSHYLLTNSRWSKTIYSYQKATIMMMKWTSLSAEEKEECITLMRDAPSFKQRIAGKSLPMEKFVIKRCKKFADQGNRLLLPVIEMMYLWNMFHIFKKNFSIGNNILKILEMSENSSLDYEEKALLSLLRGAALRQLGANLQAQACLDYVISMKRHIKDDLHLIPYAIVEIGLLFKQMGDNQKAIGALEDARKNYSSYSLESRLHFRIHMTMTQLKQ